MTAHLTRKVITFKDAYAVDPCECGHTREVATWLCWEHDLEEVRS